LLMGSADYGRYDLRGVHVGAMDGHGAAERRGPVACREWSLGRRRIGIGLSAADPVALFVYRCSRGFRLHGARGAHRGPDDGEIRFTGEILYSAAVGVCLRGSGRDGDTSH